MDRPDLVEEGKGRLSRGARLRIRLIRSSFRPGRFDAAMRWCQRHIGATWIHHCTKHLLRVHGLERLPRFDPAQSFIVVANHRSLFDLYVVTAHLVRRGLRHRMVFPVRAHFYYDSNLGVLVNGAMSFFAMYPPIFRDKKLAELNVKSLDELCWLLGRGGTFAGLHPEGTRKKDDDPYTFLSAQPGVGKVIHTARVPVIPVFVNGLVNDLLRQVAGNFDGTGQPILAVFGRPVDFGDLLDRPASLRAYKRIADRALEAIAELGQEEKRLRSSL